MADFEKAIKNTFRSEGGFQNDPADNANYVRGVLIGTNRGISAQGYATFYKRIPTVSDMMKLTEEEAKRIFKGNRYRCKYWRYRFFNFTRRGFFRSLPQSRNDKT